MTPRSWSVVLLHVRAGSWAGVRWSGLWLLLLLLLGVV